MKCDEMRNSDDNTFTFCDTDKDGPRLFDVMRNSDDDWQTKQPGHSGSFVPHFYLPVHSCECVCFHFSAYCIENDINTTYLCGFDFWGNFLDRQFPLWLVLASRAEAGQIKLTSAIDHQLTIKLRFTFNCVSLEVQVCEKGWTNRIDFCKYDHQLKCANV